MPRRIIVSGASVAGPALACWLADAGWEVTVVERAPELRREGQNVDVRGAGREVVRRLGVEDAIRARNTTETGTAFVDASGAPAASFPEDGDDSPTAELEILRGALSEILVERSRPATTYRFGDHIEAVEEHGTHATVRLASGETLDADVVAVAEGQRSATRDRLFDDVRMTPLGIDIAYFTIPREPHDDDTWKVFTATAGRQVSIRPDDLGTIRATLAFKAQPRGADRLGRDEQVALLRERFAGAGWQADRLLAGLAGADDLFYESLAQVHVPRWHRGRVVLLGDAAHCVTPLAGYGTSLALIGGYVLAGELTARGDDVAGAFAAYDATLRPLVDDVSDLPPGIPGVVYPASKLGGDLIRLAARAAATPVGRRLMSLAPAEKDRPLPGYPSLSDTAPGRSAAA